MVEPMLGTAVSPTMISASSTRNVIPGLCEVVCDCRLLPGDTPADVSRRSARRSATTATSSSGSRRRRHALAARTRRSGTRSSPSSPRTTRRRGRPLIPPGFTDSHFLREAFGTVAYGFFPMRTMDPELAARLIHSADERIAGRGSRARNRFLAPRRSYSGT